MYFRFIQGIIRSSGGTLESLDLMLFHWPVTQPRATFDLSDCVSLEYVYLGDDARFVYALSKSIQSLHQPSGALCRITILIQLLRNIFRAEQWKELRDVLQNTENFLVCDPDVTRTIADLKRLFGEESVKFETDVQRHIGVDVG
ncbi:hypothetical protein EV421DRAFT_1745177 [Armillaria borealis]|uniref:Uncharacterized protein n=1 Tax=Armillaria borealis TaxID=47425 RepID=A0AA39ISK6_9AGAR|nr:hypothetical protein EV421DRAFT_1745177 [Armillaria borealis]